MLRGTLLLWLNTFISATALPAPQQVITWRGNALVLETPLSWRYLDGPIGCVCVTGDDRVGKSTLLTEWGRSLLLSTDFAFSAGHTRSSHTRGIWSAIIPKQTTGLNYNLNLLDSQGVKQVSELEQRRLFSTNVLIADVLVYMTINVIQNDQLRDLARMAHHFQHLSPDQIRRFGNVLSPHLVVVVREENDFLLPVNQTEQWLDLSDHLESALSGQAFLEDKALIKQVFRTREAWSLQELPKETRLALRSIESNPLPPSSVPGDEMWRASASEVLQRVLAALNRSHNQFPQSGVELGQWHQSVVDTVNSQEGGSFERLVGYSELLASERQRRTLLMGGWRVAVLLLPVAALPVGIGGFLCRLFDRIAWCLWIILCVCYVGTSPLLITPLRQGQWLQSYCDRMSAESFMIVRTVCVEMSSQSIAMVLAAMVGALSYSLVRSKLQCLLRHHLLGWASYLIGGLAFVLMMCESVHTNLESLAVLSKDSTITLGAGPALVAVVTAVKLAVLLHRNRLCIRDGEQGRALHSVVAAREEQVRALEASAAWVAHYQQHRQCDALWRYRCTSVRHLIAVLSQACGLLVWAWFIRPHCDAVLASGAVANLAYLAFRFGAGVVYLFLTRYDLGFYSSLTAEEGQMSDESTFCPESNEENIFPESTEELTRRLSIEAMRHTQDR